MAMAKTLRVNAQSVLSKSGDMKGIRTRLSSVMQDMKSRFSSLGTSWDTEKASVSYQRNFNNIHKDIEEMLNIVDEYTRDLDEVAEGYKRVEAEADNTSGALPSNVF